jgi:hypothetical protein
MEHQQDRDGVHGGDNADANRHIAIYDRLLRGSRRLFHDVGITLFHP